MISNPRSSKNIGSHKRAVSVVAAVLILGVVAASLITVRGHAAGLGFRWPISISKIFARSQPALSPGIPPAKLAAPTPITWAHSATLTGPISPAFLPFGANFQTGDPGNTGLIGRTGGNTWYFSNVNLPLACDDTTYWGPANNLVRISFLNSSFANTPQEVLTYSPGSSSLANGVAVWTGFTVNPTTFQQVFTKFTMTANLHSGGVPGTVGAPIALVAPTTVGLPANVGALVPVTPGIDYQINMRFDASYNFGGPYQPALDFYDVQSTADGSAYESFTGGFYYYNALPTIGDITDKTTLPNTPTGPHFFSVADCETSSPTVSGSSSNQTLVPNANISFGGGGPSRTITVTPASGETGTATITASVFDGISTTSDTFLLTVNTPPTISDVGNQLVQRNQATGAIPITIGDAEDPTGDSLNMSGGSSNTTLVPNGNIVFAGSGNSRTVTITPANNQVGTATITITVTDALGGTATDTFDLRVNAVPVFSTNAGLILEKGATATITNSILNVSDTDNTAAQLRYTIAFSPNGGPPHQGTLKLNNVALGSSGFFTQDDVDNSRVTYTHDDSFYTSDSFQFNITDGDGATLPDDGVHFSYSFSISVNNHAPVAGDSSLNVGLGASTPGVFQATDQDLPATTLTRRIITNGTKGTAVLDNATTGEFTYTPDAGQSGTDTVVFQVNDGLLDSVNPGTVTITIANQPPAAQNGSGNTDEGVNFNGTLSATDSDQPPQSLTFAIATNGTKGTANITDSSSGAFTYTPNANAIGTDTFTFTAGDGLAASAPATFTIEIHPNFDDGDLFVSNTMSTPGGQVGSIIQIDPTNGMQALISQGGSLTNPSAIVIEHGGTLVVINRNGSVFSLIRINPVDGTQTTIPAGPAYTNPVGLGIGPGVDLFVADPVGGKVFRVDPTSGASVHVFSGGNLGAPAGLVFDAAGNLLVSDAAGAFGGSSKIVRVDTATDAQTVVSLGGSLLLPIDISLDSNQDIIVSDAPNLFGGGTGKLILVNATTGVQTVIAGSGLGKPSGVAVDVGTNDSFTPDNGGVSVLKTTAAGATTTASTGGYLAAPFGVVMIHNAPEIHVNGLGVSIPDGNPTPGTADGTEFGSAGVGTQTVIHTFTIENRGNADLNITSVDLSGTHAADFNIGGISLPAVIAPDSATTFTVTFDPNAAGLRTATVEINNDDSDEGLYNFAIQGTGTTPGETDVTVDGSGNLIITDGNGGTTADTLTIALDGSNVRITDPNNALNAVPPAVQDGANSVLVPLSAITGNIQVNTLGGNDTLTLDLAGGDFIPGELIFNGGDPTTGPGDKLVITGGSQGTVTYNYTNAHDGSIEMTSFGTVSYTGLEPITNSGTASDIIFNLPVTANAAVLGNNGTTGDGISRLSGATFEVTDFMNPTGSVTINRGDPADTLTFNGTPDLDASLTIGSSTDPFSSIGLTGPLALAANKNLAAYATGTISLPSSTSDLTTSGTGTMTLTTARDISLASGSSITTVNGALTLNANQQASPTSGNFVGIDVNNGLIQATGTGVVTVNGKGGTGPPGQYGVFVHGVSGLIKGGNVSGSTTTTVVGAGGIGTAPSSSNGGVVVSGTISSFGGDVSVTGTGGSNTAGDSNDNHGVFPVTGGLITSEGNGNVTVSGTGGGGSNGQNIGVLAQAATITSGGSGTVLVNGTGGAGPGSHGVWIYEDGRVNSGGIGTVTVTGTGGGTSGHGVYMTRVAAGTASRINSGGGAITVTGTPAGGTGIFVNPTAPGLAAISSTADAAVNLIADTINLDAANASVSAGTGTVTLRQKTNAKAINLGGADSGTQLGLTDAELDRVTAGTLNIGNSNSGAITISAGIDLTDGPVIATLTLVTGANVIDSVAGLDLTVANLNITAPTGIGSIGGGALDLPALTLTTNSTGSNGDQFINGEGVVTVGANDLNAGTGTITLYGIGRFNTVTGGSDILSNVVVASGGTLGGTGSVLSTQTTTVQSGGTVSPGTSPGILNTGNVSFNSGSTFQVEVNGTTSGTDYDQLNVTGTVSLGDATLAVSGTYTPATNDSFIVINNDGGDTITGTFTGLNEGTTINVNGTNKRITYVGGDGNDVALVPLPGTLQFSAANYNEAEQDSGTHAATITVQRAGGSDGAVSVHWATSAGTATAGTDYVEDSGDLNWADGDSADQTFTVTVKGDTVYEVNETVNLTLSNPQGGATISGTNPTTLTITNDDNPPAVLVVNTTSDHAPDGLCLQSPDGDCTLREAIIAANFNADTNTINFNIPTTDPGRNVTTGVYTIAPTSALPDITQSVTINGYTQEPCPPSPSAPCSRPNTLAPGSNALILIELNGTNAVGGSGVLNIIGGASTVKGLAINRFPDGAGILLQSDGHTIQGNFLGTNAAGTAAQPNLIGIAALGGSNNLIGSNADASGDEGERNTISGNAAQGVVLAYASNSNTVAGNYIGTNAAGLAAIPNQITGITISNGSLTNTIGGATAAARNVISGNKVAGVGISESATTGNSVKGNYIGVGANGTTAVANIAGPSGFPGDGVLFYGLDAPLNNTVGGTAAGEGNLIANNAGAGVDVQSGTGNKITRNSISANGGLGIDLGNNGITGNDSGDGDSGPNNLQNFPLITEAKASPNSISGTLNATASQSFTIEFFSNLAGDGSGNGEGKTYLGSLTNVTTDGSGNAGFTFNPGSLAVGEFVTATATDANGNTSEFSAYQVVVPGNSPPTITAVAASQQEGSPATTGVHIADVNDTEDGPGAVTVTISSDGGTTYGASATLNGVTVSGIVNTSGTITADIVAACGATNASFTLKATDTAAATATDTLNVTVTANANPTLAYALTYSVTEGNSLTITPTSPPSDNGSVTVAVYPSGTTYPGSIAVDPLTGVVTLNNAAPAGNYTVTIRATDNCGAVTDAVFTLDVTAATCTTAPGGMVAWWPGDGNADDIQGPTFENGTPQGGVTFGTGKVGQAFTFNTGNDVMIPASANLNVGASAGLTIDAWINPQVVNTQMPLVEWNNGNNAGVHLWVAGASNSGNLYADLIDTSGGSHILATGTDVVAPGVFQHVALTYDKTSGVATIYLNSQVVAQQTLGTFTPQTSFDAYLGFRPSGSTYHYQGLMDEVEIFNNALDATQVANIYNASFAGKCRTCTAAPSGMVSWWSAENNANDIYDSNNGSAQGGAGFASGKVGQAFSFNGAGQFVQVPHNSNQNTGAQITLDAWIRPTSLIGTGNASIINKRTASNVEGYTLELTNSTSGLYFEMTTSAGVVSLTANGVLTANLWQHVAATYDGTAMKIFVNGSQVASGAASGTIDAVTSDLVIGKNIANNASFPGLIDEVELFNVALSQPQIAVISNAQYAGKCHTSTIQFSDTTYSVTEGNTNATITVTRIGAHDISATVHYASENTGSATAGTDYDAVSDDLTFAPGEVSQTFTVPIHDDNTFEGPETVDLKLSAVTGDAGASLGSPSTATLTINNDDAPPSFAIGDVTPQNEGNAGPTNYVFTVTKTGSTELSSSVDFTTQDGTAKDGVPGTEDSDYQFQSGTLTFAANETTKQITVVVNGDDKYETAETFNVHLSGAILATISDADSTGTITNDDAPPSFSISDVTAAEGNLPAGTTGFVFDVTKTGNTALSSSVEFLTQNGTALISDSDYQSQTGTLTFGPTDTTMQITVLVTKDANYEPDETFTVHLHDAVDATIFDADGTGTITNDDSKPTISITDVSQNEGTGGTTDYVFALSLSNRTFEQVKVDFGTADGTTNPAAGGGSCGPNVDYETKSGTVTFAPEVTSGSITIKVCGDNVYELNEQFFVNLTLPGDSNSSGTDPQGVGTIANDANGGDDAVPVISIDDVPSNQEENFPNTNAFIFTVSLANPSYETITVDYATADGTAQDDNPATEDNDYIANNGTLTFAPGETSHTVTITVVGDNNYEANETFFVNLSNKTGTSTIGDSQGVGTINNDDPAPVFSINDRSNFEGTILPPPPSPSPTPPLTTTQTFTVSKSGSTLVNATVKVETADGSGVNGAQGGSSCNDAGVDYISKSVVLDFPATGTGSTSQSFVVTVCKDSDFEADETFTVDLSLPTNATIGDNQGTGTIKNDDVPTNGYVVTTTNDLDDGVCAPAPGHCSLREAINAANGGTTAVAINFNIPDTDSRHYYYANDGLTGTLGAPTLTTANEATVAAIADTDWPHSWWSILPTSPLPDIGTSHQVFVEGYTQPGATDNTLSSGGTDAVIRIELNGGSAGANVSGLILTSGSEVRGLAINRFKSDINEVTPSGFGIELRGSSDNVAGCFIGTDVSGTLDLGNEGSGISLASGGGHTVGGTTANTSTPEVANLISGNGNDGIYVSSVNNTIQGNLIGTKANGTTGLGNTGNGINLSGAGFNTIGIDADPDTTSGEGNTIAFNTGDGVLVSSGVGNSIRGNSIFLNGSTPGDLGIDLGNDGVTANDPGDTDPLVGSAPNNLQNFPVIKSSVVGTPNVISGTLTSKPNETFTLDFYANASGCDTSGGNGEGGTYLGSKDTTTDANGLGAFRFNPTTLTASDIITATATDSLGNTSEFSLCFGSRPSAPGTLAFVQANTDSPPEGASGTQVVEVSVKRTGGSDRAVSVSYQITDGTAKLSDNDYSATNGTLTWANGDTADKKISITVNGDGNFETDETVNIQLSSPTGGATLGTNQATMTIKNDDTAPTISISDVTLAEGNSGTTNFVFSVALSNRSYQAVGVNYATADGTAPSATAPADYTAISGTLLIPAGTLAGQITVPVKGETVFELAEQFVVNLSSATNASGISDAQGLGTITNDDALPAISIGNKSQSEGNSGSANFDFTVTLSNASYQTVTVNYATVDGTAQDDNPAIEDNDYVANTGTLSFAPGDTSKTINISVNGDIVLESNETFTVHLSAPSSPSMNATLANADGTGTIQNDEAARTLSIDDISLAEDNSETTNFAFTVTLSGPSSQTVTVDFATADGSATVSGADYSSNSGTLIFAPLETTKTINVSVNGDTSSESNETFFVNLTPPQPPTPANATIADNQGVGTILNDDTPTFQFAQSSYSVFEDTGFVDIAVTRTGDISSAMTVDYASSDLTTPEATERKDYTTAVGTLHFDAGEDTQTFRVLVEADSFTEGPEHFQLTLTNASGGADLGAPATSTIQIDNSTSPAPDAYENARNFVRRTYHDFLNREPDASGWDFWTNGITSCGSDAGCIQVKRIDTSAAFFLSIEFQETGYLVERTYKTAYGNGTGVRDSGPDIAVPIVRYREFLGDTQQIGKGVVVLQPGWETVLDNNKQAFALDFVKRQRFLDAYPTTMSATEFVEQLDTNAGHVLSPTEKGNLIAALNAAPNDPAKRAEVLRGVAEDADLKSAEFNRAFVLMQYFGYLRRNPNDPQDTNYTGYDFWLTKLNQFNSDYRKAEMVKAFIESIEYKARFIQQ